LLHCAATGPFFSLTISEDEIDKYKEPEVLKNFQSLSSVPSNSQVTVTGTFTPEQGINMACKYFGSIPEGKKPFIPSPYLKTEFLRGNTKCIIYKGLGKRCITKVLFPGCMHNDRDSIILDVLANILESRYFKKIRKDRSLVYNLWVWNCDSMFIKGYGRFTMEFGTDRDKVDEVINCIMAEINDIVARGPEKDELEHSRKNILDAYEKNLRDNDYWIYELQGSSLFNSEIESILKNKEEIMRLPCRKKKKIMKVLKIK